MNNYQTIPDKLYKNTIFVVFDHCYRFGIKIDTPLKEWKPIEERKR